MPHSEESGTPKMAPQVNGEAPSSAFLSHLYAFPIISDSINTFKSNPYGAKSLDLTSAGYEKLGKPLLPYLSKPYEYVSPYVKKADSIGDSTLSTIESKFPYVKKPTGEIYDEGKAIVFFPLRKGSEGKDYLFGVFGQEKKNVGGEGVITYGKAVVATGLVVSSDVVGWLGAFLSKKEGGGEGGFE